jgi:hypothetical protein
VTEVPQYVAPYFAMIGSFLLIGHSRYCPLRRSS